MVVYDLGGEGEGGGEGVGEGVEGPFGGGKMEGWGLTSNEVGGVFCFVLFCFVLFLFC